MNGIVGSFARLRHGLLLLVGLVLVAYGAASAWNLWSDHRRTLEAAQSDARNLAAALDEHAANVFGETGRLVQAIAESLPFNGEELEASRVRGSLSRRLRRAPYIAAINVYDRYGRTVASTDPRAYPVMVREDLAFHRDSALPRLFILAPERTESHMLIGVSTRISTPGGAFAGIVEAQIDADHFNLFYTSINVGTGGRIHLMRQDGAALVEVPDTGQAAAEIAANAALRERIARTVTGVAVDDALGILAYRRLAKLPLVAIIALARDEVMAPWRERAAQQLTAAAVVLLLVVLLSWLIWRQLGQLDAQDRALHELVARRTEQLAQRNAELQRAYGELEEVSLTDQLTGLKNRRFLTRHLEPDIALALRGHGDLLFFLVDVDHFKPVNDSHGHAAGDKALVEIARRLGAAFRESDSVVGWGGEEFLAVARGASRADAEAIAEKVRASIAASAFEIGAGPAIRLTCSVGVACFPFLPREPALVDWMKVVEIADLALYQAKASGRNTWIGLFATDEMQAEDVKRLFGAPDSVHGVKGLRIALGPRAKKPVRSRSVRAS